jgi:hypothetical protein
MVTVCSISVNKIEQHRRYEFYLRLEIEIGSLCKRL